MLSNAGRKDDGPASVLDSPFPIRVEQLAPQNDTPPVPLDAASDLRHPVRRCDQVLVYKANGVTLDKVHPDVPCSRNAQVLSVANKLYRWETLADLLDRPVG